MDDVIKKLFDNMINIVCQGIEEQYHEIFREQYMLILNNRYSKILSDVTSQNYSKVYDSLYSIEFKEWSKLTPQIKKSLFLVDKNLQQIIEISNNAMSLAEKRLNTNEFISKSFAYKYSRKMNKLFQNVFDFNKTVAYWYVSEGMADLLYASNQSTLPSLRLSDSSNFNNRGIK